MEEGYNCNQDEFWYNFIWEVGGAVCTLCENNKIENSESLKDTFEEQVGYGLIILNIIMGKNDL